jgi:hypothetical protein
MAEDTIVLQKHADTMLGYLWLSIDAGQWFLASKRDNFPPGRKGIREIPRFYVVFVIYPFTKARILNPLAWTTLLLIACNYANAQISVSELQRVGAQKTAALDSNGWKKTGILVFNVNQSARSDWGSGGETFQLGINLVYNQAVHL